MEGGRPRTAIDATSGDREELCSSREKKGRQLGLVEEGVEVLTEASNRVGNDWGKGVDDGWRRRSSCWSKQWPIRPGNCLAGLGEVRWRCGRGLWRRSQEESKRDGRRWPERAAESTLLGSALPEQGEGSGEKKREGHGERLTPR